MPKRSSKPTDLNRMAASIVAQSTDPDDKGTDPYDGKNPAAWIWAMGSRSWRRWRFALKG